MENNDYSIDRTIIGCTNPDACNYNPDAIEDDGSCSITPDACGVCDSNDFNDNLSCAGCIDPNSLNFDLNASLDCTSLCGSDICCCNYERPGQQWNYYFGDDDYDMSSSITGTADGGYIISGYKGENLESDFYLLKLDSEGSLEWEKIYGGNDRDIAFSAIQTSDDGYIVTGFTRSFGAGNNDIWVIKTDEFGNTCDYSVNGNCEWNSSQWVKTHGNGDNQLGRSIIETIGEFEESIYVILAQVENYNNTDIGLYILDNVGEPKLNSGKSFGGDQSDFGYSIKDVNDGFLITGYTNSYGNAAPGDVWIIKTNYDGISCFDSNYNPLYDEDCEEGVKNIQCNGNCYNDSNNTWARTYGGIGTDYALSIDFSLDSTGYILTGFTNSFSDNNYDLWLIKTDEIGNSCNYNYVETYYDFNNNGEYDLDEAYIDENFNGIWDNNFGDCFIDSTKWMNKFGGDNDDGGRSVAFTLDGGYIVAGETLSDTNGEEDAWILKTNKNGQKIWEWKIGESKKDIAKSIVVEENGYIITGGSVSYSENEFMDIMAIKLETDDCSYLGEHAIKDECGICCNCKTIEDFTDSNGNGFYDTGEPYEDFDGDGQYDWENNCNSNGYVECSFYNSPQNYGGAYDCSNECFGDAYTDENESYADGEPYQDNNNNGEYDDGEPYTNCNWDLSICDGDEDWEDWMNQNDDWNKDPTAHCCADIYRDDCGECYGDNVGCAEIIINEIMNNPKIVIDANGEWFELYNNEESYISIKNWKITDEDNDEFIINEDVVIPPKGYVILGNNSNFTTNGGIHVDYQYSNLNFSLFNGSDEILLKSLKTDNNYVTRDKVSWMNDSPYNINGSSQSLMNAELFVPYCTIDAELNEEECKEACQISDDCNIEEGAWITLSSYNDIPSNWAEAARINGNGIWDPAEEFTDCNLDITICEGDENWNLVPIDEINGIYDYGEPFIDINDNGQYDSYEIFYDCEFADSVIVVCEGQNGWVEGFGNNQYDLGEPFLDELPNGDNNSNSKPNFDPELILSKNEINFPDVMVTDSVFLNIELFNEGYDDLLIYKLQLNSPNYQGNNIFVLKDCMINENVIDCYDELINLSIDQSLNLNIGFYPQEMEEFSGSLIIESNDFENLSKEIEVLGNGIEMSSLIQTSDTLFFDISDISNCTIECIESLLIENIGVETLEIEELDLYYNNFFSAPIDSFYSIETNSAIFIDIEFKKDSLYYSGELENGDAEYVLDCMPFENNYICEAEPFDDLNNNGHYDVNNENYYDINNNGEYDSAHLDWDDEADAQYNDNIWDPGEYFLDCGQDNICDNNADDGAELNGLWDCSGLCAAGDYYDKIFIYSNEPGNISEVILIASVNPSLYYDMNNDNRADILDVINLVDVALGFIESNNLGDFNFDGNINVIDVSILIEFILFN